MAIKRVEQENISQIEALFQGWMESMIWSCLQGCMGAAYTNEDALYESAQIVIADFCFFAGKADRELVTHRPVEHHSDFIIMVPQNEEWSDLIAEVYGDGCKKVTRYAIKKEIDCFHMKDLKEIVSNLDSAYELRMIDEELYEETKKNQWSADLCSQFPTYEAYEKNGLGVVAIHDGEIVSGASSYTAFLYGIEIEVDTREDQRRKGLALACSAKLILECLHKNRYPSWDAQNKASVALAEKLGYHFDKEYTAYEVHTFGK